MKSGMRLCPMEKDQAGQESVSCYITEKILCTVWKTELDGLLNASS